MILPRHFCDFIIFTFFFLFLFACLLPYKELEDVCNPVINKPKPKEEETSAGNEQNAEAHNGPTPKQGAEGKADAKGSQQTKAGTKEMEVE